MRKLLLFFFVSIVLGYLFTSCKKDEGGDNQPTNDTISIVTFSPQNNIPDDTLVTFTGTAMFRLQSETKGFVKLGFNNRFQYDDINYVRQYPVTGSGETQFDVQIQTRHWTYEKPLLAIVALCDSMGNPLATDTIDLQVLFNYVLITSVSPPDSLLNGVMTTLSVTVQYQLTNLASATIEIGDNSSSSATGFIPLTARTVTDRFGAYNTTVTTKPKYWSTAGGYRVSAVIYATPGGSRIYTDDFYIPVKNTPCDSITIVSIQPNTGLVDGQLTTFSCLIRYNYVSNPEGRISVSFNTGSNYNSFFPADGMEITPGSGTHMFTMDIVPKNWGASGPFQVRAFIWEPDEISRVYDSANLSF